MEVVLLLTVENIISTSSFKQLSDQLSPQTDEILKNWTERGRVPNTPFGSANATNSGRFFLKRELNISELFFSHWQQKVRSNFTVLVFHNF